MKRTQLSIVSLTLVSITLLAASLACAQVAPPTPDATGNANPGANLTAPSMTAPGNLYSFNVKTPPDVDLPTMTGNFNVQRDFGLCFTAPRSTGGLVVFQVLEGSLAHGLNFRPGDVVVSVNGIPLTNQQALAAALGFNMDQVVTVVVQRGKQRYDLRIRPEQLRAALTWNSWVRALW